MEQSRPRHQEESFLIVVKRSWFYAFVDFIFSLFFWVYSLVVVLYMVSATLGFNTMVTRILNASFNMANEDIRNMVIVALVIFILFYVMLFINHFYNKKRYGALKRRSYPTPVCNEELKALGLMDIEAIEKLQSEDYSEFEKNPIVPLGGEKR